MTKTCIVCKKESIPGDSSRAFHKFPKNNDYKQKWMDAINVTRVAAYSTICSEHFDANCYHQTNGYTYIRRLLSNAIPTLMKKERVLSNITNASPSSNTENIATLLENSDEEAGFQEEIQTEDEPNAVKTNCDQFALCNTNSTNIIGDNLCNDSISEDAPHDPCLSTSFIKVNAENSLKRKQPFYAPCSVRKKLRFKDGFQTKYVSRTDFVNEEAWTNFLRYYKIQSSKTGYYCNKICRKEKKIEQLKAIIKQLHEYCDTTASEFLEV